MLILYLICGLFVFWYAWWGDRKHLEEIINYYTASIGMGGVNTYYPSVVALFLCIYVFYGFIAFR